MTLGTVVDLQNQLRHQFIVPSNTLGVHKGPEVLVFRRLLVGLVQNVRQHRIPQLPAFVFVRHPEVRRQIQPVGVLPEDVGTEAVDGGNLRQKQPLHLLLQPGFGVFRDFFRQLGGNLAAQLAGCRLGIGNDQKFVQIGRGDGVFQVFHQPVHQHLGLSGACRGGDQELAAPVIHSHLLLHCELIRHGPSPFPPRPRTAGRS